MIRPCVDLITDTRSFPPIDTVSIQQHCHALNLADMGNKSRWKFRRPYPTATRKAGQAGRYVTDRPSDYQLYMTLLNVPDYQSQSFYDRLKNYVGDTDPRFRKLMKGDTESLATLSRGFLEKCGREIWATEPSPWEHDRMYGRNWVAEHWLKDQEV